MSGRIEVGVEPLPVLVVELRKGFIKLFAGKEKEFEALLEELGDAKYIDKGVLIKTFGKKISEFAQRNFSLVELERRARSPELMKEDRIPLSNILDCNFRRKYPDEISIHLKPASTLPLAEQLRGISEGFAELARLLEEDPNFKKATSIFARSWMVKENPDLFRKLGFEILDESEQDTYLGARRARMSREDFIGRNRGGGQ